MSSESDFKFEPDLGFQHDAIKAAVDLFDGYPVGNTPFSLSMTSATQLGLTELGIGNPAPTIEGALDEATLNEVLLENLASVQERNDLPVSTALDGRHFSTEMETGTGKTYVYLRTLFELHQRYGFTKFVIVVPSVAIREGALASIALMREHLESLYAVPFDADVYDSKNLNCVRQFATANTMQILIMNIDAFNKDLDASGAEGTRNANVINREQDRLSGRKPIEFIQSCRPVVVIDEPQNMESPKAVAAIENLKPLCTLRYSATHKKLYNPIYRLGPIEAYDLHLVKRVEVASVVADANLNAAYVEVVKVDAAKTRAQLRINVGSGSDGKPKNVWVKQEDDLAVKSDGRQEYANGYIVSDISFRPGDQYVEFSGGAFVQVDAPQGAFTDDLRRVQISETIKQHLDRERALKNQGVDVKVLSLIFLDKVANYRVHGEDGGDTAGPFALWFEEEYGKLAALPKYSSLALPSAVAAHDGYFSKDGKGRLKDTRGESADDITTYDLIMKDKKRLLSHDEPLRFIFTHSALREGWDNPNVFQICTLNESRSTDRKRQEIGRGLRLPVNQAFERVRDPHVNRLTVIANESYEDFARALQSEYEEDTGRKFGVVERTAFGRLVRPATHPVKPGEKFGADGSAIVWDHLKDEGILSSNGEVTAAFDPAAEDFELPVPAEFADARDEITAVISKYVEPIRIENARDRKPVKYRKKVTLDPEFKALWERISKRTRYRVALDSKQLITEAVTALKNADKIGPPKIVIRVAEIEHKRSGLAGKEVATKREADTDRPTVLPDILADLQNETDLTRRTIVRILVESGRLDDFAVNPQAFLRLASETINKTMRSQVLQGIRYEEIAGVAWEMRRLEPEDEQEVERYASRLYEVQHEDKTPFDHVEIDSEVERKFAKELDNNEDVKFYIKLPSWFTVDTPIGPYNPDWAIMFEKDTKLYLVRETKGSLKYEERREEENTKIDCATAHFKAIGVDYEVVRHMDDLADQLAAYGS